MQIFRGRGKESTGALRTEEMKALAGVDAVQLATLASLLSGEKDTNGVLDKALNWLHKNAGSRAVVCYRYDEAGHTLSNPMSAGNAPTDLPPSIRVGQTVYGDVARDRVPIFANNLDRDPRFGPKAENAISAYVFPIVHQQALYAIIAAQSEHDLSQEQIALIKSATPIIASVMGLTQQLYDARRAQLTFDRLQSLAQRLTTQLETGQLLQDVVNAGREMLDTDISILLNLNEQLGELHPVAWSGIQDETAKLFRVRSRDDIKGLVAWAKKPARSSDLRTDQRTGTVSFAETAGMISEMAVPVMYGDILLGILAVEAKTFRRFTDPEMELLQSLASHAGVAMRNAQLFEDLRTVNRKMERAVADTTIARQQAENARIAAVEATRLKTEFINNMSHELRTPLNTIINFTRIMSDGHTGEVTEQQGQYLGFVRESGEHLLGLINDILDMAKIEAGRMEIRKEFTSIEPILRGVMSTAVGLTRENNLSLKLNIPADLPNVEIDTRRIRQVLLNLVSNAAKFTQKGSLTLGAERRKNQIVVYVKDTGIGIKPEDLDKVFEEFRQIDGSLAREQTGTGLGMPISKKFIELHGGEMWIQSQFGVGTTVYFSLPVLVQQSSQQMVGQQTGQSNATATSEFPAAEASESDITPDTTPDAAAV